MGKTNWKRVFLGGLVIGIVELVLGLVIACLFYLDKIPVMNYFILLIGARNGLIMLSIMFVIHFVAGILTIWLYSKIRLKYGTGFKTVALAVIVFFIIDWVLSNILAGSQGNQVSTNLSVIGYLSGIGVSVVAPLTGTWVYKERP